MASKRKDSITNNILRYSSSKVYMQVLGIFTAFIKPKLLTPELYGLLNILNLIPTYAGYIHLGSRSSMRYLIPYYEGRNEHYKNKDIKGSVFYGSLYLTILIVAILVFLSLKGDQDLEVRLGFLTMVFIVIMTWYYGYYMSLLKSYQNFKLITSSNYLKAPVTFFLSIILIYYFGIYGAYLAAVLTLVAVILYLRSKYPLGLQTKFQFRIFRDLIKMGLPIMLFSISFELIRTSDRVIVFYFLGIEQLGYYGIASMVISFLIQIPGAAREVIEPRLMQDLNGNSEVKNLNEYFFKPLFNTAYLLPLLLGPIVILLPYIIPLLLPRYIPGIVPAQINVLGCYFFIMSYPARGIIIANNWQLKASSVAVLVLFININLSIILLKLGMGLKGIALGSSISFFILFIFILIFIKRSYKNVPLDWKTNIMGLCWPFPIMCSSIIFLKYFSEILSINEYVAALINIVIFCMIMFVVISFAQKKHTLLKKINLGKIWQSRSTKNHYF